MADALSVIPAGVLRNLADKLYEKRKNAALEVSFLLCCIWFLGLEWISLDLEFNCFNCCIYVMDRLRES